VIPHVNDKGREAEQLALLHLTAAGLRLKSRNYACRLGEIDLILEDGETLVFVEVRQRRNARFGSAAESITGRKQDKLVAAARHYLARQKALPACRFDAVLVDAQGRIEWIRDAFGA
jgi:putative endonuclease